MLSALLAVFLCADAGTPSRATVVIGGDVIPHSPLKDAVRTAAGKDVEQQAALWAQTLAPLRALFATADLVVVNLEGPVVDGTRAWDGPWIFSAPPALAAGLKRAGVGAVSFANNHARDQHLDGVTRSRALLDEAGLKVFGAAATRDAAWAPLLVELNGIKVGLLGFTRFLNRFQNRRDPAVPHVPFVPYPSEPRDGGDTVDQLLAHVKAARAGCDVLVVMPHWGHEYAPAPMVSDRALAQQLLDAGATAVVGAHPHVVQEVLRPGGALIAFSLGNLLSNQAPTDSADPARAGMLLSLTFEKDATGTRLAAAAPAFVFTDNRWAKNGRSAQATPLPDALAHAAAEAAATKGQPAKRARARAAVLTRTSARLGTLAAALESSPPGPAGK